MLAENSLTGINIHLRLLAKEDDTDAYVHGLNDCSIYQYLESSHQKNSPHSCRSFDKSIRDNSSNILFGIFCSESNKYIGNIKLGSVDRLYKRATIGLVIGDKNYWEERVATQAIQLKNDFAFEELKYHKLDAGSYVSNEDSVLLGKDNNLGGSL